MKISLRRKEVLEFLLVNTLCEEVLEDRVVKVRKTKERE